jgi:hypothetical protein
VSVRSEAPPLRVPCRRRTGHRHVVTWVNERGHRRHFSDRCRSLLLWSTAAFHVLAGDDPVEVDGKPIAKRPEDATKWAEGYVTAMEADALSRGTARGLRSALRAREARRG